MAKSLIEASRVRIWFWCEIVITNKLLDNQSHFPSKNIEKIAVSPLFY